MNDLINFPFQFSEKYSKKVAYFSMEFAIDQCLKIYSGGLGFLSGSHMRSAFDLKQNMIGIGVLWKYGYYDQTRDENGNMQAQFVKKQYTFLQDLGLIFPVLVHGNEVKVKAMYLPPTVFNTAPIFLLTTDIPENDILSKTITDYLYDKNEATRVAQSIVLGIGGGKLLDLINHTPEIYHMNEGHALPLAFYLLEKHGTVNEVKNRLVFTTHTPELAGNEERTLALLKEMNFFGAITDNQLQEINGKDAASLNYTLTALRLSKKANGVSIIHQKVAHSMWSHFDGVCEIKGITNAQNKNFWIDSLLNEATIDKDYHKAGSRKYALKKELFKIVADQTGKLFNPDYLTIVWARRFAGYKRADLICKDLQRFVNLINNPDKPVQIIWAGKPYPFDDQGINIFNDLVTFTAPLANCAVLTGYEMGLSAALKKGADVWLNTPRPPQEASGTSGMTAAMNGSINFSIMDGWFPEFANHGENSYIIPGGRTNPNDIIQDEIDYQNLIRILTDEIVPTYYQNQERWEQIRMNAMQQIAPQFDSGRMAGEYYELIYN